MTIDDVDGRRNPTFRTPDAGATVAAMTWLSVDLRAEGVREGTSVPSRALRAALPGPAAAPAAQVEADQAGGAVVAGGDVAVGDVVPVDVGGVDDRARDGGAARPHRRGRARSADREPALLTLVAGAVVDRHTRGGIRVERDVGRGAPVGATDLAVAAERRLRRRRSLIGRAAATAARR